MLRAILITSFFFSLISTVYAKKQSIGKVLIVKGKVYRLLKQPTKRKQKALKKNSAVFEKDVIKTSKKAFAKILLTDQTIINVGPNSMFSFRQYLYEAKGKSRVNILRFLKGKFRTKVQLKARAGDKIKLISSKQVALGVRGTEILSNVYKVGGKLTNDVALLSGKAELEVAGKKKALERGEVFNSNKGLEKIEKLSEKEIQKLTEQEEFLENRQDSSGKFKQEEAEPKQAKASKDPKKADKQSDKESESEEEWVDCDEDDEDEDCQYDFSDMIQVEVEES